MRHINIPIFIPHLGCPNQCIFCNQRHISGTVNFDENEVEIKIGDYIGVQVTPEHMEYYTVVNDGRNNFSNEMSTFGYLPSYRRIECAYVDQDEFNG